MNTGQFPVRRPLAIMIAMALLISLASSAGANPGATPPMVVDTTVDSVANDGLCSLREAIIAANTQTQVDTCGAGGGFEVISLPAGLYILGISGAQEDDSASGDLDIKADVTIEGAGAEATIIDAAQLDRVLQIHSNVTVTIRNISIQNGLTPGHTCWKVADPVFGYPAYPTLCGDDGGGIHSAGTLSLKNCIVRRNHARDGGGAEYMVGGDGGRGGGIYVSGGGLTLLDTYLLENIAGSGGDAINTVGGDGGSGGGLYVAAGPVTVWRVQVAGNFAGHGGRCTQSRPWYSCWGGDGGSGGGIFGEASAMQSSIVDNRAGEAGQGATSSGQPGFGGGLNGGLRGSNLTVSGNDPVGIAGDAHLSFSTITGNAGGISGSAELRNTIVAGNALDGNGQDCIGTATLTGDNLIGNSAACTITGDTSGLLLGVDPLLAPLADNGGPTKTHALLPGSPAIDAGSCADLDGTPMSEDQRGMARPSGRDCDLGAYEFQFADVSLAKSSDPEPAVTRGLPLVYTLTVENLDHADAQDIVVADTLPAGVSPTGLVELPLGTVAAGDTASEELAVTIDTSTIGLITNEATVSTSTPETDTDNNSASLVTMVTDDNECTRLVPYWQYQFLPASPTRDFNDATLQAFLDITNYASTIFSEEVPVNNLQEAHDLLWVMRPNLRQGVEQRLLAGWLNFAQGAVGWYELVDTNKDGVGDTPFQQVMAMAEALLANPDATNQELAMAGALAMAVNVQDGSNPACRQLTKADPVGIYWSFLPLLPHRWR